MSWGRSLGAWCALVALCASWVAQGQIIQSLQNSEKSTFYPSVRNSAPPASCLCGAGQEELEGGRNVCEKSMRRRGDIKDERVCVLREGRAPSREVCITHAESTNAAQVLALTYYIVTGSVACAPLWLVLRVVWFICTRAGLSDAASFQWQPSRSELRNLRNGLCLGSITFLVIGFWSYSLSRTSVSANTAIYNTQNVFVYLLSIPLLGEAVTVMKVASVIVCLGGVVLISFTSYSDDEAGIDPSIWGYVLVVASTLSYAAYEVLYALIDRYQNGGAGTHGGSSNGMLQRDEGAPSSGAGAKHNEESSGRATPSRKVDVEQPTSLDESSNVKGVNAEQHATRKTESSAVNGILDNVRTGRATMALVMFSDLTAYIVGMGIVVGGLFWVGILVADVQGWEEFVWPDGTQWGLIIAVTACSVGFYYALSIGIMLSTALWISTGTLLTLPLSLISDAVINDYVLPAWSWVALVIIVVGFLGLNLAEYLIQTYESEIAHTDASVTQRVIFAVRPLWMRIGTSCSVADSCLK